MVKRWRVPRSIQWLFSLFVIYLVIFTLFRVATVIFFKPEHIKIGDLLPSFWLGLRYDLRWITIILLPIIIASWLPRASPFLSEKNKRFWTAYLGIITLLVLFFYGADFGQFAYVNARLNADALIFAQDPKESLKMIWQSYPIVWILIALLGAVLMMTWMFRRTHVGVEARNKDVHKFDYSRRWHFIAVLLAGWFIYGFFLWKPLNFFRAFSLNDEFKSNLALNPMQNFFTTLRFREPQYNTQADEYFNLVSDFLKLPTDNKKKNYTRIKSPGSKAMDSEPNVVLVICESFSMYKSSLSGNPLNATPYFASMAKDGIFFNRCFSPSFGTARGVFSIITGTPDVQLSTFATRNEATVNQRTIINNFNGYDKFYFIGGRSQFNNFKGLYSNIHGLKIYEEGVYNKPAINVWGISDKDLFLEANKVFAKQEKPFFAIIQTADNHRPYMIPADEKEFRPSNPDPAMLKKYGFESDKEFNAFAYMDFSIKKFMEAAQKETYFANTIFVFVGDHGVEGNAKAIYPNVWTDVRLTDNHIPLLYYAPHLLAPQKVSKVVSQIDLLPTLAGMIQQPYINTTLGRNVLDTIVEEPAAFIIYHAPGWVGVVNDDYYYRKNIRMNVEELYSMKMDSLQLPKEKKDSVKRHLSKLTNGLYETARWMLVNNKNK